MNPFKDVVATEEEIRELIGFPSEVVQRKTITELDSHCRNYIAMSPLLFMATSDTMGNCDVSPRGDAPGFVHIIDHGHIVIPERPGNRRIDSMRNILSNPRVGLIFLIPGLEETLRVNGEAYIIKDDELLEQMKANGKKPLLGIGVRVEEAFIHCAKSFKRSGTWNQDSWADQNELPSIPHMISAHVNSEPFTVEKIREGLKESYEKRLY